MGWYSNSVDDLETASYFFREIGARPNVIKYPVSKCLVKENPRQSKLQRTLTVRLQVEGRKIP